MKLSKLFTFSEIPARIMLQCTHRTYLPQDLSYTQTLKFFTVAFVLWTLQANFMGM